jgi:hypothetical protein
MGPLPGDAVNHLREARTVCMRDMFILNEIWAQDKMLHFGTHVDWLKYFTCQYRYWLRTISSTFCRLLKLERNVIH